MSKIFFALFIFLASIYSQLALADHSPLTYSYTTIYNGTGGQLTIYNHGAAPAAITSLQFSSNASTIGTPWGTLGNNSSPAIIVPNPDGIDYDYTLTENSPVIIAANSSAVLTYNLTAPFAGPFAPYNAAMNSFNVKVSGPNLPLSTLNIEGMCTGAACNDPAPGKRMMGYFPNWAYWRAPAFTADQLPYDKINTVAYAFSIFDSDGQISLYDQTSDSINIPIIAQARLQHPYLNASLAFGGWSWASVPKGEKQKGGVWQCQPGASPQGPAACFSQMAANPDATKTFIANAVQAMKEVHFNGIDIDWEYPQVKDAENYRSLLQGLRTALDNQGKQDNVKYYLTIAVSAGVDKIKNLNPAQWQAVANAVDYIDVMTYDFHGSWDQGAAGSDFMSAMQLDPKDPSAKDPVLGKYDVTDAMLLYTNDNKISPAKLVVGIPVYGRMATIDSSKPEPLGLYQPITGTPQGEWDNQMSGSTGMIDYKCIVDKTTCGNGYSLPALTLVDPTINPLGSYALTPWGYSDSLFITYDDAKSAAYKANWIKSQGFAGAMLWDLTGDFADTDNRSIVKTVTDNFNH